MQQKIEINYEEGEGVDKYELHGTVIMKRLNFTEKNSIEEESTDIKMMGTVPQIKVSTSKIKELGIFKSVVSTDLVRTVYHEDRVTKLPEATRTPYNLDMTGIRELPQDVGNQLLEAFTELNAVNEKKN